MNKLSHVHSLAHVKHIFLSSYHACSLTSLANDDANTETHTETYARAKLSYFSLVPSFAFSQLPFTLCHIKHTHTHTQELSQGEADTKQDE